MQFNIPAEHKHASGVYIIRNTLNNKVYLGSTINLWGRYGKHRRDIKAGKHHSRHLQAFVNKHGCNNLSFELQELCAAEKEEIIRCEQKWLDYFTDSRLPLFNCSPTAYSLLGLKRSEETKKRMSAARKALGISPEHRKKLSDGYRGRKNGPPSDETRLKLREAAKRRSSELIAAQTARLVAAQAARLVARRLLNPDADKEKKPRIRKPRNTKLPQANRSASAREWWAGRPQEERKQPSKAIAQREATRKANEAITPRKKWSDEARQKASEQRKGMNAGTKWSAERIAKRTATLKANRLAATSTLHSQLTIFS